MLNELTVTNVWPSGIEIAYERRGNPTDPVVLLIMGLAAQMVNWPEGFLAALALDTAHVVGASLGGAIAQTMAIEHPARILSLTSMMSTTGDMTVGQAHPETLKAVFSGPPATTRQSAIDRRLRAFKVVGSPAYPTDPAVVAESAGIAWDRDHDDVAIARQAVASVASGDRTPRLRRLEVPTLVIHGLADTMCDVSGGRATAAAIPGAELVLIDGMGHDLAPGLWERMAGHIAEVVQRGEAAHAGQWRPAAGDAVTPRL